MKSKSILVLGGSGMAGHTIGFYLHKKGHNVTTLTRNNFIGFPMKNILLDVMNINGLESILQNVKFDVLINCIGLLNNDANRNPDKAVFLNSYLPHFLSNLTKNKFTKLIHISTDCVFSGKRGRYTEDAFKDGLTFYDLSKSLGEINNSKDLTFRTSIVGPDLNVNGIGLFNWFMKQEGIIKGYKKAIWSGVTTLTLAKAINTAIDNDLTGLYHLVNNEQISKFDLLNLFNSFFKKNETIIQPDFKYKINKSLLNTRTDFNFEVPSYDIMISEMKEWIIENKVMYPHYKVL